MIILLGRNFTTCFQWDLGLAWLLICDGGTPSWRFISRGGNHKALPSLIFCTKKRYLPKVSFAGNGGTENSNHFLVRISVFGEKKSQCSTSTSLPSHLHQFNQNPPLHQYITGNLIGSPVMSQRHRTGASILLAMT